MDNTGKQNIEELARKFLNKTATPDEQALLHKWYDEWKDDEEEVQGEGFTVESLRKSILSNIQNEMNPAARVIPIYTKKWFRYSVAASLLLFGLTYFFYLMPKSLQPGPIAKSSQGVKNIEVKPGSDKAILKLSDGRIIELDSAGAGVLALQGNTSVINKNGKIEYEAPTAVAGELIYNTITTPRGAQYQVVLPDGTKVWLNSASSIKFPVVFASGKREVELTGEAYFEVAKDNSKPFIAKAKNVEVQVLGTHFNIMCYDDDEEIATTLLEGAVKVSGMGKQYLMKPGQQAVWNQSGSFQMNDDVNLEEVVAWKNGKFYFNNADIKTIMRQISRWYDITVSYQGPVQEEKLGGIISRKENVEQLLKTFEMAGKLKFKLDGRNINVTK